MISTGVDLKMHCERVEVVSFEDMGGTEDCKHKYRYLELRVVSLNCNNGSEMSATVGFFLPPVGVVVTGLEKITQAPAPQPCVDMGRE